MKPTRSQSNVTRTVQWVFPLLAGVVLTAAVTACTRDLPDLGPTYAPLQTATPTVAAVTSAPVPTTGTPKEAVSGKVPPLQTVTSTTSSVPGAGPPIESVYSYVASIPGGSPLRPLFEHLPKDREPISSLARALEAAVPIEPDDRLHANERGRYLSVSYGDGTKVEIRQVSRCVPKSEDDVGEPVTILCKGEWVREEDTWWVEGVGMVRSAGLSQWWDEMPQFMVRIGILGLPEAVEAGEPFTMTLYSWDGVIGGDSINLGLVSLDGTEIGLGTFPASDTFQGQLTVPGQTPSGRYWLRVSGGKFSELVRAVTVSNDENTGRQEVSVREAWLESPDRLVFTADTCNENPEVSLLRETDAEVQVLMNADSYPFRQSYPDCVEAITVQLQSPLGGRVVVDQHTGRVVSVTPFGSTGRLLSQESGTENTSVDDAPDVQPAGKDGAARHEIAVEVAWLDSPDTLVINANTCHRDPELALFRETDIDVTVKMVVGPDPYPLGGPDCLEELIVQLDKPLGHRPVIDAHNGRELSVTPVAGTSPAGSQQEEAESQSTESVPPEIRDAVSDAELQDLQAVAEQYGMTLQEAFDRYAWNDDFSRAAQRIREVAPDSFTGAAIVDATNAWIAFTGTPPKAALDIIDEFTSSHSRVTVEVRTSQSLTEAEIGEAVSAVYDAVAKTPGVLDAIAGFDPRTNRIGMTVVLKDSAPDSVLDELQAIAEKRLVEVTRPDILDSISVSVVRLKTPVLGGDD